MCKDTEYLWNYSVSCKCNGCKFITLFYSLFKFIKLFPPTLNRIILTKLFENLIFELTSNSFLV